MDHLGRTAARALALLSTTTALAAPGLKPAGMATPVGTAQIAPTIVKALGYAAHELEAMRAEGTQGLPGLPF